MDYYDEHPSKAAAWRAGELVVFPDVIDEDTTVWFAYHRDEDGSTSWEGSSRIASTRLVLA